MPMTVSIGSQMWTVAVWAGSRPEGAGGGGLGGQAASSCGCKLRADSAD